VKQTDSYILVMEHPDDAVAELDALAAELASCRARLAAEVKNKQQFERDWLEACEKVSETERDAEFWRAAHRNHCKMDNCPYPIIDAARDADSEVKP
jgi:hypothetical protein